jgi:hypothetical protein
MDSTKIYTSSHLQQQILSCSQPCTALDLQNKLSVSLTDLDKIIQDLLWQNAIVVMSDLILSKEKYEQELEKFQLVLRTEQRAHVSQAPRILLLDSRLERDDKYFYDVGFLEEKGRELSQVVLHATMPVNLKVEDLGIDLDLLNILKLKYLEGHIHGHWIGLVFVPKIFVVNLTESLNHELNQKGIVDITSYEYIDLNPDIMIDSKDRYVLDKYIMNGEYMLKQAQNIQLELKKKGFVQKACILDVKVSEKILKLWQDHLPNTIRILNFYVLLDLVNVIKAELRDLVKEIAQLIRIKRSREEIEKIKALGFNNVLKDYVPEEIRRELEEIIEKDFMRQVEAEVKKTFKEDLGAYKVRDLRSKIRRIEGFYRGLQLVKDGDLRVKLEKVLLKVKVQEVLQNLGISQDIKDWEGWKHVIAKNMAEGIFDLEMEIEKEEYLQKLKEQLKESKDAPLVLHLVVSILFIKQNGYSIYFTGKSVPDVLRELKPCLPEDTYLFLDDCLRKIINLKKTNVNLDNEIIRMKEIL